MILGRMEKPETPPPSKAPASFHIRNDGGRPGMAIRTQQIAGELSTGTAKSRA